MALMIGYGSQTRNFGVFGFGTSRYPVATTQTTGVNMGRGTQGITPGVSTSGAGTTPSWLATGAAVALMTGSYKVLNFSSGLSGFMQFFFGAKWSIGGMVFDGIMRTEHLQRVRPTTFPVQSGVVMTDHAIIEPAELTIEIMMSDANTGTTGFLGTLAGMFGSSLLNNGFNLNNTINQIQANLTNQINMYSNILTKSPGLLFGAGRGRSSMAWSALVAMMQARVPLTVETRLQSYRNMIIEELSAPDDFKTLNALRCTVRLREIIVAEAAETKTSARAAATAKESKGGNQTAQNLDTNKTAAKATVDKISEIKNKKK